ncbi:tRNA 2-selenouridine(34) synthase MnmH [Paenibacillus aurantius]|uniref:tRNA 2-selenouridine(34) synthase MnmH n=1 Tax=Paenibacillus aurantius TaxID=2918900 RepID=A0AA96LA44_9BACL|nr:tRNA 2-selenouridine(34) synthase MnmH [Paenibacillus aurantius]WNQ09817.1 tRNA 2-selenouridine(34) synthase MnmH [Paenibacillus aurantius]
MFQDITIEELLEKQRKGELTVVDVRSPSEYEEGTIPGSLNRPLFDDEERREIGTLYKQVSVDAAKERGLEIVARKLPEFVKELDAMDNRKAVFCWRGGMRSRTAATLLSLYGARVYRLQGGIRAYRQWVVKTLEEFKLDQTCIVLNGHTGTGKTVILSKLAEQGYPVLDLEELAGHRGSIFGQIGRKPSNQKSFEAKLVHELLKLQGSSFVLMEAESRRVGKVTLPDFLMEAKENGKQLLIELPVEERIRHILEDYRPEEHKQECLAAFRLIEKRIHTPIAKVIEQHLQESRFAEAVQLLLVHYYDPRYEHAIHRYNAETETVQADTIEEAVEAVRKALPRWV